MAFGHHLGLDDLGEVRVRLVLHRPHVVGVRDPVHPAVVDRRVAQDDPDPPGGGKGRVDC